MAGEGEAMRDTRRPHGGARHRGPRRQRGRGGDRGMAALCRSRAGEQQFGFLVLVLVRVLRQLELERLGFRLVPRKTNRSCIITTCCGLPLPLPLPTPLLLLLVLVLALLIPLSIPTTNLKYVSNIFEKPKSDEQVKILPPGAQPGPWAAKWALPEGPWRSLSLFVDLYFVFFFFFYLICFMLFDMCFCQCESLHLYEKNFTQQSSVEKYILSVVYFD